MKKVKFYASSMWKMKEYNELTLFYLQMRFCSTVRPVAATVANLPSIHYFVTHFAEMVTRPLTSPVQPR